MKIGRIIEEIVGIIGLNYDPACGTVWGVGPDVNGAPVQLPYFSATEMLGSRDIAATVLDAMDECDLKDVDYELVEKFGVGLKLKASAIDIYEAILKALGKWEDD